VGRISGIRVSKHGNKGIGKAPHHKRYSGRHNNAKSGKHGKEFFSTLFFNTLSSNFQDNHVPDAKLGKQSAC
jgi:hypothetical protein